MSRKYRIGADHHAHFVTFTVVEWLDFFIREEYRKVLVESIEYCQLNKGLVVHGYCIMTSHLHFIISTKGETLLEHVIRDFKRHTSTCFHKMLTGKNAKYESRRDYMLWVMREAGKKNSGNNEFQFWQQHNHPIELYSDEVFDQKLTYIHMNPVVSGFVFKPEQWLYSSARNYAGLPSVIKISGEESSPGKCPL